MLPHLLEEDLYEGLVGLLVVLGHRILRGRLSWRPAMTPSRALQTGAALERMPSCSAAV
jgi:hypothetical protein